MHDPIANMINMVKNAGNAGRPSVSVPYSKIKYAVGQSLVKYGYLASVQKKTEKNGFDVLELGIAYNGKTPRISGLSRVSKPSCRLYVGVKDIKSVKNGFGSALLSTPKGILSDKDARKELVGGEILFTIW